MEEHGINSATLIVHSVKSRDSITWSQDSTNAQNFFPVPGTLALALNMKSSESS